MLPRDLKAEQFAGYPPEARKVAAAHLDALRQLPVGFVPSLLREIMEYDYKFPVERLMLDRELADLDTLTPGQVQERFHGFAQLSVSPELERFDWVGEPAQFVEKLSAYLWSTHQLDAFRKAATEYGDQLESITRPEPPAMRRLGDARLGDAGEVRRAGLSDERESNRRAPCPQIPN